MTANPTKLTQEESVEWAAKRLENERDELTERFGASTSAKEQDQLAFHIAKLSLAILRIDQHLEDFEDLKHFKSRHGERF